MSSVVVIPIKSFHQGNQRLSSAIDDRRRERLGRALASHVAAVVESAGMIPLIVTADPAVAEWARLAGFPDHQDPGDGLNAAAAAGVEWTQRTDGRWLVLHGDLPLVEEADLDALMAATERGHSPIAPSADGGTSAIGSQGSFSFSFGPASFHRHLVRLDAPEVVHRRGLAFDIDSPRDLEVAISAAGPWLKKAMA